MTPEERKKRLADIRDQVRHAREAVDARPFYFRSFPPLTSVHLEHLEFLLSEIDCLELEKAALKKEVESDRRYHAQLNEAFNSGDGSYHP